MKRSIMAASLLALVPAVAIAVSSFWAALGGSASGTGISPYQAVAGGPRVAIGTDGLPVVAWTGHGEAPNSPMTHYEVFVRRWNGTDWVGLDGSDGHGGISNTPEHLSAVSGIAVDRHNNPVVCWTEQTPSDVKVYVKRWNGEKWEELGGSASGAGISGDVLVALRASLGLDLDGQPVVCYDSYTPEPDQYDIRVKRWDGERWTSMDGSDGALIVSHHHTYGEQPALVVDGHGRPNVAWIGPNEAGTATTVFVRRWDDRRWVGLGHSDVGNGIEDAPFHPGRPSIAAGPQGPVVAWSEFGPQGNRILAKGWNGSDWQAYGNSGTYAGGLGAGLWPSVAVGPDAHPIVAWTSGSFESYLLAWDGQSWKGLAGSASGGGISNAPYFAFGATLALGSHGAIFVAWSAQLVPGQGPFLPSAVYLKTLVEGDIKGGGAGLPSIDE